MLKLSFRQLFEEAPTIAALAELVDREIPAELFKLRPGGNTCSVAHASFSCPKCCCKWHIINAYRLSLWCNACGKCQSVGNAGSNSS
ncbi:MAG: hypothetical protein R2788_18890 [Saprospiraceae bacterium]